jgi:hypothetical protein
MPVVLLGSCTRAPRWSPREALFQVLASGVKVTYGLDRGGTVTLTYGTLLDFLCEWDVRSVAAL